MVRKYVLEIKEYWNSTSLADHRRVLVTVLKPEDAEKVKTIYLTWGKKAAIEKLKELQEVSHKVVTVRSWTETFGGGRIVKIVADEPFVAVIDEVHDMPNSYNSTLKFEEAHEVELSEEELKLMEKVAEQHSGK